MSEPTPEALSKQMAETLIDIIGTRVNWARVERYLCTELSPLYAENERLRGLARLQPTYQDGSPITQAGANRLMDAARRLVAAEAKVEELKQLVFDLYEHVAALGGRPSPACPVCRRAAAAMKEAPAPDDTGGPSDE